MLEAVELGAHSGLWVSPLCLGTMNFGEPGKGHQGDWTLGADAARPIFRAAIEHGINYFDCADTYGRGACERVVGQLLREFLPRDGFIVATKIGMVTGPGPENRGLSRKHILRGVDASLSRLGLDHIDHLVIHRHPHGIPGHPPTPIEESLEALDDVVQAGKVRFLGASSMFAWQFVELQMTARQHGWTPFISMQNHYNLIYREEEREMNPYCAATGVGLMPWSPLARGILAGTYQGGLAKGTTARSRGQDQQRTGRLYRGEMDFEIAGRVVELAGRLGITPAQVAIAWLLNKPEIISPVVGVSRPEQLHQLVEATEITLEEEDTRFLGELYKPVENLLSIGYS